MRFLTVILLLLLSACCNEQEIPNLIRQLNSSQTKNKTSAALELARCGESAGGAVKTLSKLIYDPNVGVQSASAYALRKIDTEEARKVLRQAEERRKRR